MRFPEQAVLLALNVYQGRSTVAVHTGTLCHLDFLTVSRVDRIALGYLSLTRRTSFVVLSCDRSQPKYSRRNTVLYWIRYSKSILAGYTPVLYSTVCNFIT